MLIELLWLRTSLVNKKDENDVQNNFLVSFLYDIFSNGSTAIQDCATLPDGWWKNDCRNVYKWFFSLVYF